MGAKSFLKGLPIAPRKVRLVADLIRKKSVARSLALLKHEPKKCAVHLQKLLLSAVNSWEHKNEGTTLEEADLCVEAVWVNSAGMLKRVKSASRGRTHRIRKRSSHVTLLVDSKNRSSSKAVETA